LFDVDQWPVVSTAYFLLQMTAPATSRHLNCLAAVKKRAYFQMLTYKFLDVLIMEVFKINMDA